MTAILMLTIFPGLVTFYGLDPEVRTHLLLAERKAREIKSWSYDFEVQSHTLKGANRTTGSVRLSKPDKINLRYQDAKHFTEESFNGRAFIRYDEEYRAVTVIEDYEKCKRETLRTAGFIGLFQFLNYTLHILKSHDDPLAMTLSARFSASKLSQHFHVNLVKEDDYYLYLECTRRNHARWGADQFIIVLYKPKLAGFGYLPAVVQWKDTGSGHVSKWTLNHQVVNPEAADKTLFEYKPPPEGWTVIRR